MSVTGGPKAPAARRSASRLHWAYANTARALALLRRPPREQARPRWHARGRVLAGMAVALSAIVLVMVFVDPAAVPWAKALPSWTPQFLGEVTEFGKSSWFLVPIGGILLLIATLSSTALAHSSVVALA